LPRITTAESHIQPHPFANRPKQQEKYNLDPSKPSKKIIMNAENQSRGIVVQIAKNFKSIDVDLPKLEKLVTAVCARFEILKAAVGIAIVSDTEIRKLNKQFLNHSFTTDCLSFDLSDLDTDSSKSFELVVNAETAVKEANLRGHSSEAELALYITHGLLHNLGFDDSTRGQAKKMHNTEDEILQQLGYGLVYNKGTRTQK
jgi:probable rRNA maturation factor